MDKRIIKSIEKIKKAYLDLLFEEEPSKIQVKDLCKLAGINRSTFYDRFGYLDTLEDEIIEDEIMSISFEGYQLDSLPISNNGINKEYIRIYINKFLTNKVLMRFCTVDSKAKYVGIMLHKQVELCTKELTKISYYNAYFQGIGAIATLIEWVNNAKDHSIDDMVEIIYKHSITLFDGQIR